MSKYIFKSATELAQLIRNGKVSSTEVVKEHLDQIKKYNPILNAVVILFEEECLREAAQCDQEAKEGNFRGPLHGVPFTVKEQFSVKGTKSTLNTRRLKDWVADEDALIIRRLKEAGALILGKTNLSKDLLDYQVSGDIYPECKNPYNTDFSPGGSSGGSAAALASGMIPIELGGDFGGSIRIPSNFCGVYGLKTTENTLPGQGTAPKPKSSRGYLFNMAVSGPMARTPEDLELVWRIIVGPDKSERAIPPIKWEEPVKQTLSEFRIAWVSDWPNYETSSQTREVIESFVSLLNKHGCATTYSMPGNDLHGRTVSVYKKLSFQMIFQEMPWFIKPLVINGLKRGFLKGMKNVKWKFKDSFIDYSEAKGIQAGIISEWEAFLEEFDFLICPSGFGPAYKRCKTGEPIKHDGKEIIYINYVWPFNCCFNASGHPAMNIPLGIGENGLPVGVMLVGPYWSELKMLHFAKLISKITGSFVKPEGFDK